MSSRCAASSWIVWSGRLSAPVARACARTSAVQSCVGAVMRNLPSGEADACDLPEGGDEPRPVGALIREYFAAGLGDAVIAAPPLAGAFDPAPADPPAIFQAVQRGVERGEREAE